MKNINWKTIIPYLLLIVMGIGLFLYNNKVNNLTARLEEEIKLRMALIDSVTEYHNIRNELVSEKLTLQTEISNLNKIKDKLSADQKELLKRLKEVVKEKDIIAAALIKTKFELDSIRNSEIITDVEKQTIVIRDSLPDIQFNFVLKRVIPAKEGVDPTFKINQLVLPNTQFIEFHWNKQKRDSYPISFSVSNSNKYIKVYNIESYAIPELIKPVVKPTFWQKLNKGVKQSSKYLIGVGIGAGAVLLLK